MGLRHHGLTRAQRLRRARRATDEAYLALRGAAEHAAGAHAGPASHTRRRRILEDLGRAMALMAAAEHAIAAGDTQAALDRAAEIHRIARRVNDTAR